MESMPPKDSRRSKSIRLLAYVALAAAAAAVYADGAASAASSASVGGLAADALATLKVVKERAGTLFALVASLLSAYLLVHKVAPSIGFMARSLFRESRWPRAAAVIELSAIWWALRFALKPNHIEIVARLRVEFEILRNLDRAQWREEPKKHTAELVRIIRRYTGGDSVGTQTFATRIEDCSPLTDSHETVESYFRELECFGIIEKDRRFLLHVEIGTGFVAAQYLLYGLLAQYDDNWTPVLEGYGAAVQRAQEQHYNKIDARVVEIQAYQFNCWLLWGPSIPMCRCVRWSGGEARLLQLGYGDECNSVCLAVRASTVFDIITKMLGGDAAGSGVNRIAIKVDGLKGALRWSSKMTLCPAQKDIGTSAADEGDTPVAGRPVIELADLNDLTAGGQSNDALSYYSAYMWVIFVLCDDSSAVADDWRELTPRERPDEANWRNVLPFFEHGNIADSSTLDFLGDVLVAKIVNAVNGLLALQPSLRLRYACAFDDPMCEGPQVPHKAAAMLRTRLSFAFANQPKVHIPSGPPPEHSPYHRYCSCMLPSLTSRYAIEARAAHMPP